MADTEAGRHAEYVAVRESAMTQLIVTDAVLKAMSRLNKRHDPKRVLAAVKEWVHYMDQIQTIMAYQAAAAEQSDGEVAP